MGRRSMASVSPCSFRQWSWIEEHSKTYQRSESDARAALSTLCSEGLIGDKGVVINLQAMKYVLSNVGDKLTAENFDGIIGKGVEFHELPKSPDVSVDDFLKFL